jgi:Ca2+-binding RTX toxin-like protein
VLAGGKGRNTLSGGSGNDVLDITGGRRDKAACGKGRDRVKADANDKVVGCERVKRRKRQ